MFVIICSVTSILTAQGFLHTFGTKIVNGNGNGILLRGIGLGGWLVPEGYMLHTSGFANSPTDIQKKITDLVGPTNTDLFFKSYRQNYVTRKDIDSIAKWGFNSIRLPMHYNLLTPKGQIGVYLDSGFVIIDSLLSWCEANHLYLILDLHCAPGGQNSANISDYSGYPSLWESTTNQQQTVDLWKEIARRYANRTWIGGYDLLNETVWDFGSGINNKPLRDLYIAITDSIRTVDKNHIIFIEGNQWANDFTGLTPPWDTNMAYSFHKYWNANDQQSISWVINIRNTYNVPLWCGEAGENSNQWLADCIALFENNNIGWSWWSHKKIESTAVLLSSPMTSGYNSLLQYWNNPVSKPSVQDAMNALNSQVANLNINQCTVRRDVIDALFRQPLSTATLPFVNHTIPGTIYAVDYDLGKNNCAYKDNGYQNSSGQAGGAVWNSGGQYRNDGVDIELCSDSLSNGYDVGWIESGEFLTFTVTVVESGVYDIGIRVAANAPGGLTRLMFDGLFADNFLNIPITGGWQLWQNIPAGQVQLTAGIHTFSAYLFSNVFNVNCFIFSKTSTSVEQEYLIPSRFELVQNYPNPFNPTTTIEFTLAERGNARLMVFNMLGQEIATLFDQVAEPARLYRVVFDGSKLTSGVYAVRLQTGKEYLSQRMMLLK